MRASGTTSGSPTASERPRAVRRGRPPRRTADPHSAIRTTSSTLQPVRGVDVGRRAGGGGVPAATGRGPATPRCDRWQHRAGARCSGRGGADGGQPSRAPSVEEQQAGADADTRPGLATSAPTSWTLTWPHPAACTSGAVWNQTRWDACYPGGAAPGGDPARVDQVLARSGLVAGQVQFHPAGHRVPVVHAFHPAFALHVGDHQVPAQQVLDHQGGRPALIARGVLAAPGRVGSGGVAGLRPPAGAHRGFDLVQGQRLHARRAGAQRGRSTPGLPREVTPARPAGRARTRSVLARPATWHRHHDTTHRCESQMATSGWQMTMTSTPRCTARTTARPILRPEPCGSRADHPEVGNLLRVRGVHSSGLSGDWCSVVGAGQWWDQRTRGGNRWGPEQLSTGVGGPAA